MQHANFSTSRFAVMTMDLSLEVAVEWVSALQMKSGVGPGRVWGWGLARPSCSMSARCDRRPRPHPAIWTFKTHTGLFSPSTAFTVYMHRHQQSFLNVLYRHSCTFHYMCACVWCK